MTNPELPILLTEGDAALKRWDASDWMKAFANTHESLEAYMTLHLDDKDKVTGYAKPIVQFYVYGLEYKNNQRSMLGFRGYMILKDDTRKCAPLWIADGWVNLSIEAPDKGHVRIIRTA